MHKLSMQLTTEYSLEPRCRDVVSVSTSQSRDIVSKRLGLVETWEGLGLDLDSDWKSNVSVSSRSRTIGSRLQANMHNFLLSGKIARTSFWMQGVYIVYWFISFSVSEELRIKAFAIT